MGSVVPEICPVCSTYRYIHPWEVLFVSSICSICSIRGLGVPEKNKKKYITIFAFCWAIKALKPLRGLTEK